MNAPDEFDYGDELPRGLGRRLAAWITLVVFTVSLFGTAIVDTAFPVEPAKLIGAEKAEQEARRGAARLRDGTLAKVFEDDLRERSRVRAEVLPPYAFLKYAWLGEGTRDVLVGSHDWIFMRNRVELAPFEDEWLADLTHNLLVALDRRLASQGRGLVLIPIPRKAWVARAELPRGMDAQLTVDDVLIEGLLASGVTTVDLREVYRAHDPEQIYFKADTHWTPTGAWLAAEATGLVVAPELPEERRLGTVTISPNEHSRQANDLLRALGVNYPGEELGLVEYRTPLRYQLKLPAAIATWYEQPTPAAPLALAGTSFSHQQRFARSLAHFCGRPVWDGARPASPFLGTTVQLLRAHRGVDSLRRVLIEFPIGPTYNRMLSTKYADFGPMPGQLFAENGPLEFEVLSELPRAWWSSKEATLELDGGPWRRLLELPAGYLAHSGDGAASLLVRGEVSGAPLELALLHASHRLHATLPAGEFEVLLPLIAGGPTAEGLELSAHSKRAATLRLDTLALARENAGGEVLELERREQQGLTRLTSPAAGALGRRSTLSIALGQGLAAGGELWVEVHTEAARAARSFHFTELKPGARLSLDLGGLRGERFVGADLRSAGGPRLGALVTSAQLVGAD